MTKTLLITVSIGNKHNFLYKNFFAKNHRTYAKNYNYDLIVIEDYLDKNNKLSDYIFLQKLLICSQKFSLKYENIVYIDSDILFNLKTATSLDFLFSNNKICIADEYSQPTSKIRLQINKLYNWEKSATDYYKMYGFNLKTKVVLNSGFMIFKPRIHKTILENIYYKILEIAFNDLKKKQALRTHLEQATIGYEFQKKNLWTILPKEWNAIWLLQKMSPGNSMNLLDFYAKNKAVHFCTGKDVNLIPKLLSD
jgi:hypothetical protein